MKKILFTIAIGIVLLVPSVSFAAEEKFLEFASDVGVPIEVPSGSVAVQDVRIYNDFIDAVDLWYDNAGSSGSVTVALLSASNVVLTSKTVTAAQASAFYTGQRLHVTFPDTIGIVSGSWYRLRITSNTPEFRLYGINRIQFVEHNAPSSIVDAAGNTTVDGESQLVAFKFALYEEFDTNLPIISNASAALWGSDAVKILFNASELVDRSLLYGPVGGSSSTIAYSGNHSICFEGVRTCEFLIDTARGILYGYRLFVRDSNGNEAFFDGTFESWSPDAQTESDEPVLESSPLVISDAQVVSATYLSVNISWHTDRAANSELIISYDPIGSDLVARAYDRTYELVHTLSVGSGITAGANYYAILVSRDEAGVTATDVLQFTAPKAITEPPIKEDSSPLSPVQIVSSDISGSAFIAWDAPAAGEPAGGYRVDIIDARGNLVRSVIVPAGTHSFDASGLVSGDYRVIVYGDDGEVLKKITDPAVLSVRRQSSTIDTYELIKRPIVYVPSVGFVLLVAGLYLYGRKTRKKRSLRAH